jgi:hypothetical protein
LPSGRGHYRVTLDDALAAHRYAIAFGGLPAFDEIVAWFRARIVRAAEK